MSETDNELKAIRETKEIRSSTDYPYVDDEINAYLRLGWIIIEKWVSGYGDPRERRETMHVLLGWSSAESVKHPPEKQYTSFT